MNGKPQGQGKYTFTNGTEYIGEVKDHYVSWPGQTNLCRWHCQRWQMGEALLHRLIAFLCIRSSHCRHELA